MSHRMMLAAFSMIAAASPAIAAQGESGSPERAPDAPPGAYYCLRIEPITGSRIEAIECKTRLEWSLLDLDVDKEWAENGFKVIT